MPITLKQYIVEVRRLESKAPPIPCEVRPKLNWGRLVHAALGLLTEVLELRAAKGVHAQLEELGDICWFAALAADELGVDTSPNDPPANIENLCLLIETFGSRVKGALFYKKAERDSDQYPWDSLPIRIFNMAVAIARAGGYDVIDINLKKLAARYEKREFTQAAATERDVKNEAKVIEKAAQPQFLQANTRTGQIILGD